MERDSLEDDGYPKGRAAASDAFSAVLERNETWIERITTALLWVPLVHYDSVQRRAEDAMSEMFAEIASMSEEIKFLRNENTRLRRYVATVAAGLSRKDMLAESANLSMAYSDAVEKTSEVHEGSLTGPPGERLAVQIPEAQWQKLAAAICSVIADNGRGKTS